MERIYLRNKEEFDAFVKSTCEKCYYKTLSLLMDPIQYPCVCLYEIREPWDGDGSDYIYGDFVYLDDFENN